jgi:autotransporter translocation and assembly factor TamB
VIYIDILGDKRKPKLQFKSKPMMSKKDIFSYLLFGFAVSESDGAQSSAANAAEKIFGRALAKDLARELKLDRLDLTRNQLGGIDIKAGKKVNKKTIIYYQNKSLESSVIVERKLGKHFELDVEAGQESQAVDLFYKKGFK